MGVSTTEIFLALNFHCVNGLISLITYIHLCNKTKIMYAYIVFNVLVAA